MTVAASTIRGLVLRTRRFHAPFGVQGEAFAGLNDAGAAGASSKFGGANSSQYSTTKILEDGLQATQKVYGVNRQDRGVTLGTKKCAARPQSTATAAKERLRSTGGGSKKDYSVRTLSEKSTQPSVPATEHPVAQQVLRRTLLSSTIQSVTSDWRNRQDGLEGINGKPWQDGYMSDKEHVEDSGFSSGWESEDVDYIHIPGMASFDGKSNLAWWESRTNVPN